MWHQFHIDTDLRFLLTTPPTSAQDIKLFQVHKMIDKNAFLFEKCAEQSLSIVLNHNIQIQTPQKSLDAMISEATRTLVQQNNDLTVFVRNHSLFRGI